jgi:hypothetical protein
MKRDTMKKWKGRENKNEQINRKREQKKESGEGWDEQKRKGRKEK